MLTVEQVDATVLAGAKFIVSPGFDAEIVDYCIKNEIPVFPGCISPSEVAQAVKRGLKVVKFFPAEPAGGISMIKAMAAPYVGIKYMPTGGINAKNLEEYLFCDKIICCGGSWMVKGDLVKAGEFDKIRELTAEVRKLVGSIRKIIGVHTHIHIQKKKLLHTKPPAKAFFCYFLNTLWKQLISCFFQLMLADILKYNIENNSRRNAGKGQCPPDSV